jgi:DNA-binding NarL/FixJ family response regulator
MADGLLETVTEILARRPASVAHLLAEAVRRHCAVEHVSFVSFQGSECSVLAAAGPELLAVGTTAPSALSTRLVRALEGRPWSSADLAREPAFDRPVDQLAAALGIRSGAAVPICSAGEAIGAVLLSSTVAGRPWAEEIERVDAVAGLIALGLGLGREPGEPLRVVVVHRDPLTAHGLARVIERGLLAEVVLAVGPWDPELAAQVADADVTVVDVAALGSAGLPADGAGASTGRLVLITENDADNADNNADEAAVRGAGTVVDRRAVLTELIPAVARAAGRGGPSLPTLGGETLTPRERELLLELCTGSPYKQIAGRLGLSTATVRGYSRSLYAKLDVHSRGEAVHKAAQAGLTQR